MIIKLNVSKHSGIRLIVGLGNPGAKYESTRHNAGVWFVDAAASQAAAVFKPESKFKGEIATLTHQDQKTWLFKPQTYMNDSGEALRSLCKFYKIPTEQILVVHDEIDLPVGTAKIKWAGGHGGHNGLRSIFSHLDQNFWRLRLGVGHPGRKEDVTDYVLSRPGKVEIDAIKGSIIKALTTLDECIQGNLDAATKNLHTSS